MKRRFAHDLKIYYYHNTIYGGAFRNAARSRTKFDPVEKICSLDKNYAVFIIGDADMASYELTADSFEDWQKLKKQVQKNHLAEPNGPAVLGRLTDREHASSHFRNVSAVAIWH